MWTSSKIKWGSTRCRSALTLLEMMVAVTLLALIMIGLLAMFNQTQKALHIANAQTDVFENARGADQITARDLSEMASAELPYVTNVFVVRSAKFSGTMLSLPGGANLATTFQDAFWITRANDEWRGIGYFVDGADQGAGTLYRVSESVRQDRLGSLFGIVADSTNIHRVSDGVVHFAMQAVYVTNTGPATNPVVSFERTGTLFTFPRTNSPVPNLVVVPLPAFVDLEIGVLEPATLKQYRALTNTPDPSVAEKFLVAHAGKVHFFRERVPIRNFVNPYRSNEVP